jgi:hypothetical protein
MFKLALFFYHIFHAVLNMGKYRYSLRLRLRPRVSLRLRNTGCKKQKNFLISAFHYNVLVAV